MTEIEKGYLRAYSLCEITAVDLRRKLGGVTYGDVLRLLSEANLPLPRASTAGREEQLSRARDWMLGEHGA